MDTKSFTCFLQVCRDKSISKASKSLFISPQGLSRIIKNMEAEFNVPLFTRENNGIRLTQYGRIVEKKAKNIVTLLEEMDREIEDTLYSDKGEIQLASAYGVLNSLTPDCIFEFRKRFPNIYLNYLEMSDNQTDMAVINGEADFGFAIEPVKEELFEKTELLQYRLYLLANKKNPLSQKEKISILDLKGQDIIIESKEFKINKLIVGKCRRMGFEPNIIFETSGFILCHKLCIQNKGITITVENMLADIGSEEVKAIPFEEDLFRRICLVKRKNTFMTSSMERFQNFMKGWVRNDLFSGL